MIDSDVFKQKQLASKLVICSNMGVNATVLIAFQMQCKCNTFLSFCFAKFINTCVYVLTSLLFISSPNYLGRQEIYLHNS